MDPQNIPVSPQQVPRTERTNQDDNMPPQSPSLEPSVQGDKTLSQLPPGQSLPQNNSESPTIAEQQPIYAPGTASQAIQTNSYASFQNQNNSNKSRVKLFYVLVGLLIVVFIVASTLLLTHKSDKSSQNQSNATLTLAQGEQLTKPPENRPTQYIHQCIEGTVNEFYIAQGTPNCLPGSSFEGNTTSSDPRQQFNIPCKAIAGTSVRYVYTGSGFDCPSGTSAVR